MIRKNRRFAPFGIAIFLTITFLLSLRARLLPLAPQIFFRNGDSRSAPLEAGNEPPSEITTDTDTEPFPEIKIETDIEPLSEIKIEIDTEPLSELKTETPMIPFTSPREHLIPPKIWQIMLPGPGGPADTPIDPQSLMDTASWLARNPGYGYILVGQREADFFINTHFSDDERILRAWQGIRNPGVKSDLLRYLMLFIEGGVYTDVDTEALKPIDLWVPMEYRDQARAVIGIEFDQLDGVPWLEIPHRLQFCQWSIAAAPGHPVFMKMAHHTIDVLESLAAERNVTLDHLELSSPEVMTSSGPASWTDVVLEQLKEMNQNITDVTDFSGMKSTGPRLVGDILILTIDGFGMGQQHSDSTNDDTIPEAALLRHKFRGSWRSHEEEHAPETEVPVTEVPVTETPFNETPFNEAPLNEAPVADALVAEAVVIEPPSDLRPTEGEYHDLNDLLPEILPSHDSDDLLTEAQFSSS